MENRQQAETARNRHQHHHHRKHYHEDDPFSKNPQGSSYLNKDNVQPPVRYGEYQSQGPNNHSSGKRSHDKRDCEEDCTVCYVCGYCTVCSVCAIGCCKACTACTACATGCCNACTEVVSCDCLFICLLEVCKND